MIIIEKENVLISACLLGVNCKYSGGNNYKKQVELLKEKYNLIPICPEIYGGLETPREPSEIVDSKVLNKKGIDVTYQFKKGAEETLKLAEFYKVKFAILKEKSPSCGFEEIYDGTFSGKLKKGNGITAELLFQNGIKIIGESNIEKLESILER